MILLDKGTRSHTKVKFYFFSFRSHNDAIGAYGVCSWGMSAAIRSVVGVSSVAVFLACNGSTRSMTAGIDAYIRLNVMHWPS